MNIRPKLPREYSATVKYDTGKIERRFVCEDKHRIETTIDVDGKHPIIFIRRSDLGVIWAIHPTDHIYFESKTAEADADATKLFPPLEVDWTELRRIRIDDKLYRHFCGCAQTRHGAAEEHIYIDPESGMFRRERSKIRGMRIQIDYLDIDLNRPKDELFDFSRKGYRKVRT